MVHGLLRVLAGAVVGAGVAWYARVLAHSKQPTPEGRWREITAEELSPGP